MDFEKMWNRILSEVSKEPVDICTVPGGNRIQIWFNVYCDGEILFVDRAKEKKPSSKMNMPRRISRKDFMTAAEYYERWVRGEVELKRKAIERSQNASYTFGLIAHYSKLE